eukprot:scaffold29732_cov94-Skeletonema_marinoi.AAC.6
MEHHHHDGALRLLLPSMPTSLDKQYMMSAELHFCFPFWRKTSLAGDSWRYNMRWRHDRSAKVVE